MKRIFLVLNFLVCILSISAQEYSVSQLKGISWEETGSDISYRKSVISFSDSEFIDVSTYLCGRNAGKVITSRNKFYLSSYKPTKFNSSLVGKNTKGKYLVVNLQDKYLYVFEICYLSKELLSIKFYNDVVFTYKKSK